MGNPVNNEGVIGKVKEGYGLLESIDRNVCLPYNKLIKLDNCFYRNF